MTGNLVNAGVTPLFSLVNAASETELRAGLQGLLTAPSYSWVAPILESTLWEFAQEEILSYDPRHTEFSGLAADELVGFAMSKVGSLKSIQQQIQVLESQAIFLALDYYIAQELRKKDAAFTELRVNSEKKIAGLTASDAPTLADMNSRVQLLQDAFDARLAAHSARTSSLNFGERSKVLRRAFVLEAQQTLDVVVALIRAAAKTYEVFVETPAAFESDTEFVEGLDMLGRLISHELVQRQSCKREISLLLFIDADGLNVTKIEDLNGGEILEFPAGQAGQVVQSKHALRIPGPQTILFELTPEKLAQWIPTNERYIVRDIGVALATPSTGLLAAAIKWDAEPGNKALADTFGAQEAIESITTSNAAFIAVPIVITPPTQSFCPRQVDPEEFTAFGRPLQLEEKLDGQHATATFYGSGVDRVVRASGPTISGCDPMGTWELTFGANATGRYSPMPRSVLNVSDVVISLRLTLIG